LKKYEKEAFLKTFTIFFLSLALLVSIVASFYYNEQKHFLEEQIFSQMKDYTYDFKSNRFEIDVITYSDTIDQLNLVPCNKGMCGYFSIPTAKNSMFQVILPSQEYDLLKKGIIYKVLALYALIICAIALFALFYSFYALYPLKKALDVLEIFLKDVIHDLNTPVTSILLNVKTLLKKQTNDELERIELAAQTIASLYRNLESLQKGFIPKKNRIDLAQLLQSRTKPYQKLYPKLHFAFETEPYIIHNDEDAIARIFDNLLSNACKYNQKNGNVIIGNIKNIVTISDTGIGINDQKRVFERYYKEHATGLGLGLHIVKTLCDMLEITIELHSTKLKGTTIHLIFPQKKNV